MPYSAFLLSANITLRLSGNLPPDMVTLMWVRHGDGIQIFQGIVHKRVFQSVLITDKSHTVNQR